MYIYNCRPNTLVPSQNQRRSVGALRHPPPVLRRLARRKQKVQQQERRAEGREQGHGPQRRARGACVAVVAHGVGARSRSLLAVQPEPGERQREQHAGPRGQHEYHSAAVRLDPLYHHGDPMHKKRCRGTEAARAARPTRRARGCTHTRRARARPETSASEAALSVAAPLSCLPARRSRRIVGGAGFARRVRKRTLSWGTTDGRAYPVLGPADFWQTGDAEPPAAS